MMSKVKVLHIIKSLGRGGAEMLLPETLALHDQSSFEFHYVYFLPWKNQMVDSIREAGGKVQCFKASNNLLILLRYARVVTYIKENDIALIHCHLPWAGFLGRLIHLFLGIPVIYTEHNKQERYHRVTAWLNRFTFNWQDLVVAVSNDVAVSIATKIKPRVRVQTVPNGVNTSKFFREKTRGAALRKHLQIPDNAVIVGTIAVFRFQKRLHEWLRVANEIKSRTPDAYFVVVGDGPLKQELLTAAEELGIEKTVLFPGIQTDVKPWLSMIDIFLMTSIHEGLPIALLEAMSVECAIATTDAGGIKEVVRDGVDGCIVDVGHWMALSTHVVNLIVNKEDRERLGKAARQRVVESFSLVSMVFQLEGLYRSYTDR